MNNPAARLLQILTLCKKHEKESGTRPMLMGWRKVFRMAESVSDFAVMEQIGRVYAMVGEVSDLVGRFKDLDPQLYLGWREELGEAFLNLSFRSEFGTFASRLPRTMLVNVEFCSNALSERCPEPMVDSDKLAELGTLATDLIKQVPEADLDEAGQRYFMDYLTLIRRSVTDYPLSGAPALQGAIDACTGTLVTQRQVSLATRETPIGKKFWSLINKISRLLAPAESEDDHQQGKDGQRIAFKAVVRQKAA
ncbi:MAG: hypothetical protein MUE94_10705 [Verrucomicrobia bacterium]|nr:hypothetical protein [Verrucomicrobiota bacterium]